MKSQKKFTQLVRDAWEAIKGAYHPKYHPMLRSTMLRVIAADDKEFADFVELMSASGWDAVGYAAALRAAQLIKSIAPKETVADSTKNSAKAKRKNFGAVNKELDKSANTDVAIIKCKGCGQFTEITNAKNSDAGVFCNKCVDADSGEPVLHQCHYCGDMYHVSDLTGAKMGLICYKCRHEMENRD